jgi:alanine-glyoxylate transaminase/serine-glyoxylate transaminase/serine-pyruvate transaminase
VHGETSTGTLQPLQEISDLVHNAGALFMVDAVTTYCGVPLKVDELKIDAAYGGSQKCLSAPPGLSPVTFSQVAVKIIENRKVKAQSWFLDLSLIRNYWEGQKRVYHHTAPVSSFFAFFEAVKLVLEEGLENRWARHQEIHQYLKKKIERLGFRYVVEEKYRLPVLNTVYLPEGIDESKLRTDLLNKYNIEVGAGAGVFAGKILRIGLMGESCTKNNVNVLVGAMEELLRLAGRQLPVASGQSPVASRQ